MMPVKKPRVWATVSEPYAKALEGLVKVGFYVSQGEAVRAAIRLLLKEHDITITPEEASGW